MTEDQWAAYKTARATRPAWATALIVAGVLLIAGAVMLLAGMSGGWLVTVASAATAVVAGVLALTRRAA